MSKKKDAYAKISDKLYEIHEKIRKARLNADEIRYLHDLCHGLQTELLDKEPKN